MNTAPRRLLCAALLLVCAAPSLPAAPPDTRPVEGLHRSRADLHAFRGGTVVIKPGSRLEGATLIVRGGLVVAVGQGIEIPPGARVWDVTGRTLYPAFIDAYGEAPLPSADTGAGAGHWNRHVRPQARIAASYKPDADLNEKLRGQGFAVRLVAPRQGIVKGVSALVTTDDAEQTHHVVHDAAALHLRLTISRSGGRENYPNSPMGAVALARQAFYDADWLQRAAAAYAAGGQTERPETNEALTALAAHRAEGSLTVIDAPNELFALRAADFANEFELKRVALRGSGKEYRRLDELRAAGLPVIVPLDFPKPPNVASAAAAREVRLEHLLHWDLAPENPARLANAGVAIVFTAHGLKKPEEFLKQLRLAVDRGLPADAALHGLTLGAAKLLGCSDRLGSLEPGKAANLIVADGDLFAGKSRVRELWVDGRRYPVDEAPTESLAGRWRLAPLVDGERSERFPAHLQLEVKADGDASGCIETAAAGDDEPAGSELKHLELDRLRIEFAFDARPFGREGMARVALSSPDASGNRRGAAIGQLVWPDGETVAIGLQRQKTPNEAAADDSADENDNDDPSKSQAASFAVNFPLGAFGLEQTPEQAEVLLLRGATVWTAAKTGVLEDASILIEGGRIKQVGKDIEPPEGAQVIDLAGKHISPGIIDCHSHMATDGGINESSQAITAEVRIGDFIDSDDITIYRQLAGGVTSSNILHGSANPIGGQNQVIKLRWGAAPNAMKFEQAPAGIKFALGENVKQSNWGDEFTTRYPQTRMGVEQIMRDAFHAAREYQRQWDAWNAKAEGLPPRRDLELEAIAEILAGRRWIHCHSYRQDEILAFLRTLDDFKITIGSFQHILEGYKVADAKARHGATGSAFSDWWAYKFEVYDAIPYNASLMHEAGVIVSLNSDDRELARHLNHEAAKAMKYGGVPAEEALKFVTLNPARQLRIEEYVGSIEAGKHADLVVWSAPPLSTYARCEQTWIDGRKYFDLDHDRQLRQQAGKMRQTLIQKILASGLAMQKPGEGEVDESELWPREDLFCHGHDHGHEHH